MLFNVCQDNNVISLNIIVVGIKKEAKSWN